MEQKQASPRNPIIIQIVGYKNSGKTKLICRLTEMLKRLRCRVGTIKHDAHDFQMDTPGTDTWQHQAAGADITAIASSKRTAILKKKPDTLRQLINQMSDDVDVILIEGFKEAPFPKIIMLRNGDDFDLIHKLDQPLALVLWPEAQTFLEAGDNTGDCAQAVEQSKLPRYALHDLDMDALLRLLNL
ncbi:molybdopterin-guanine dinucleotide biosynthesis protein B [Paenibacillus sp. HB172176]|uniref:molybdopterin-guanine dinucleotide biosynthesis protein B n=1 Tax=Paenibacillus sp. HB172176 TaxID=2493690 RepID=UPI00143BE109|nr:molybdopterin-guanine dinucleotide biosynthesis protein B [Paenibacillus sp. HB172176]